MEGPSQLLPACRASSGFLTCARLLPPPCLPQAFEQVLAHHPEWRGKLVLVQVTSAAR